MVHWMPLMAIQRLEDWVWLLLIEYMNCIWSWNVCYWISVWNVTVLTKRCWIHWMFKTQDPAKLFCCKPFDMNWTIKIIFSLVNRSSGMLWNILYSQYIRCRMRNTHQNYQILPGKELKASSNFILIDAWLTDLKLAFCLCVYKYAT